MPAEIPNDVVSDSGSSYRKKPSTHGHCLRVWTASVAAQFSSGWVGLHQGASPEWPSLRNQFVRGEGSCEKG